MANMDDFKRTAAETAETIADKSVELARLAADKTKALARVAKLYAEIASEKEKQRRAYLQVGKLYCEAHAADAEEAFSDLVDQALAAGANIALKRQEIEDIKISDLGGRPKEDPVNADVEEAAEAVQEAAEEIRDTFDGE